jgi:hypothetical protein
MLGSDEAGGVFDSSLFRDISVLNSLWEKGESQTAEHLVTAMMLMMSG